MSRLLHAAARGARLQVMADNNWYGITQIYMPFRRDARAIRIHPEDSELAYGPISTALREAAEDKPAYGEFPKGMSYGLSYYEFVWTYYNHGCNDELQRSLFLLILAEALADEGL